MRLVPRAASSLARNATRILSGRLAAQSLLVLCTVLLARRLGLTGFAGYAVLASIVSLANVATTFGTDMVLVREIARGGRVDRWRAGLAVQVGLSVLAVAAAWSLAPFLPWPTDDGPTALRIYSLALLPFAATSIGLALLRGTNAMGRYAAIGIAGAAVQLAAVLVGVGEGASLITVAWVLLAVQAVVAGFTAATVAAHVRSLPRRSHDATRAGDVVAMARASVPIGVLGLLGMLYQRAPVLFLAAIAGPAATAFYASANRIAEGSKTGHVALFSALFPVLAGAPAAGSADTPAALRWSWRVSVGMSVVLAAAVLVLSPFAIGILYGPDFAPAAPALAILAVAVIPSTAGTYRSLALIAARREPAVLRALVAGLVVLAVGLASVPAVGWIGACWAVVVAEMAQLAVLLAADRRPGPAAAERRSDATPFASPAAQ